MGAILFECHYIVWIVRTQLISTHKCPLRVDLTYITRHRYMRFKSVPWFWIHVSFLHRFGPVLSIFDLLHYNHPKSLINECIRIFLPILLGEPHMQLFGICLHPVEVEHSVANHSIFVE
jgi:hypothetical protein